MARATMLSKRFAGQTAGSKAQFGAAAHRVGNAGDFYLAGSVGLRVRRVARAGRFAYRQRGDQVAGIDAIERRVKCGVVFAGARRIERKLHAAAVSSQSAGHQQFAVRSAVIFSDADNDPRSVPLTSNVPSETRPSISGELSFPRKRSVERQLARQFDAISAHLLFNFRKQAGRNQNCLQLGRV